MQLPKCEIHKSRNVYHDKTFRLCVQCFRDVSQENQKALIDNYLQGQGLGYVEPTIAFKEAMAAAVGDVFLKIFGLRDPDKSVRDANNNHLKEESKVEWGDIDGEIMKGKVKRTYWETQEITVAFFKGDYPMMKRMEARLVKTRTVD